MSLATLKQIVPPPEHPQEAGTAEQWQQIAASLGITFPSDYRDFLTTYGTDRFAGFYFVLSPMSEGYSAFVNSVCDALREQRESYGPDSVPYPIDPEPHGLLPWGGDENGNTYYWLTDGPPDRWQVVQDDVRGSGLTRHSCGLTDFFVGIMQRTIPALAGGYPPIIVRCPIESCAGWAKGSADAAWYCETCSCEWDTREDINRSIAEIIKARPYRAACYTLDGDNFNPTPRDEEPDHYDALVAKELDD